MADVLKIDDGSIVFLHGNFAHIRREDVATPAGLRESLDLLASIEGITGDNLAEFIRWLDEGGE